MDQETTDYLIRILELLDLDDGRQEIDIRRFRTENRFFAENLTKFNENLMGLSDVFIGRRTYLESLCLLAPRVLIGRFCSFANFTHIGASQHPMEHLSTGLLPESTFYPAEEKRSESAASDDEFTIIGCDVWIGAGAGVLGGKGIRVGHGACIGAGTIVTRDVPPYAVVVGNPARIVKSRFDDETVADLLRLKWWTLPDEVLAGLPFKDIRACIEALEDIRASG